MNFNTCVAILFDLWKEAVETGSIPQTVCLLGAPGIGKTAICYEVAARQTAYMRGRGHSADAYAVAHDLSSKLPEDLGGLPYREGKVTEYAPPRTLKEACDPQAYGVLVLDDLPAASTAVQVAARQLSLTHRVHDHVVSPRVMIVVTGNRREDRSAASTLPAHFRNSVLLLMVEPDFKTWESWAHSQGIDPLIGQFLTWRPQHFSRTPSDADVQGAFATPRTWMMLAGLLRVARKNTALHEVAAGLVGSGVAQELVAFDLLRTEIVPPEQVLADPERALPDRSGLNGPDRMIAMVAGLADAAIHKAKQERGVKTYVAFFKALAYVTETGGHEYVATSIATFISHGGDVARLHDALGEIKGDPRVSKMMKAIAACFK